jgi:ribosomal protein S27E
LNATLFPFAHHPQAVTFTPEGSLVVAGLDMTIRCYGMSSRALVFACLTCADEQSSFSHARFGSRTKVVSGPVLCVSAAPVTSRYEDVRWLIFVSIC